MIVAVDLFKLTTNFLTVLIRGRGGGANRRADGATAPPREYGRVALVPRHARQEPPTSLPAALICGVAKLRISQCANASGATSHVS